MFPTWYHSPAPTRLPDSMQRNDTSGARLTFDLNSGGEAASNVTLASCDSNDFSVFVGTESYSEYSVVDCNATSNG